jgi:chromosome segregation ATPase
MTDSQLSREDQLKSRIRDKQMSYDELSQRMKTTQDQNRSYEQKSEVHQFQLDQSTREVDSLKSNLVEAEARIGR